MLEKAHTEQRAPHGLQFVEGSESSGQRSRKKSCSVSKPRQGRTGELLSHFSPVTCTEVDLPGSRLQPHLGRLSAVMPPNFCITRNILSCVLLIYLTRIDINCRVIFLIRTVTKKALLLGFRFAGLHASTQECVVFRRCLVREKQVSVNASYTAG